MKKVLLMAVGLVLALSMTAQAQWNDSIGEHFADYVLIPFTNNVPTQGIQTGRAYACFIITNFPSLTEVQMEVSTNTGNTSSMKQWVFAFNSHIFDVVDALASTNKSTKMSITEQITGGTAEQLKIHHGIISTKSLDGATVITE